MNRRSFLRAIPFAAAAPSLLANGGIGRIFEQDEDALICARKFELARSMKLRENPINEIIVEIGKSFIDTEYVAHSLEVPGEERLVVNLRALDCVLFCENSLALARCVKKSTMTFDAYKAELQYIRYRGGKIDRYPSRLHYFSDHIYDNQKKGVVRNVTASIGGIPYEKAINFMSTHVDSYAKLKEHPEFVPIIRKQEALISKRRMYHVPEADIEKIARKIKSGDIIAITCNIPGLDIVHTGIALWQKEKLHLMHAPIAGLRVLITENTLAEYLAGNAVQTGIMVARPLEPAVQE
jgi:hypothetical protein